MTQPARNRSADRSLGRTVRALSAPVEQHLKAYAMAAAAAGVGVMALTSSAHAQVVYTPASIKVTDGDLFLDFNCGPAIQFFVANRMEGPNFYGNSNRELELNGSLNASVMADGAGPLALPAGSVVGSSRAFTNAYRNERVMASAYKSIYYFTYTGVRGNWANTKQAFLGLKFEIQGQTHYGWAEFSVDAAVKNRKQFLVHATLLGYAYEATPNQSIMTGQTSGATAAETVLPQPGTLQGLAQGAPRRGSCPDYESHSTARRGRRGAP
jgi:hypothetical protein